MAHCNQSRINQYNQYSAIYHGTRAASFLSLGVSHRFHCAASRVIFSAGGSATRRLDLVAIFVARRLTGVSSSFADHRSDCVAHRHSSSSRASTPTSRRLITGNASTLHRQLHHLRIATTPPRRLFFDNVNRVRASPSISGCTDITVVIIADNHLHQHLRIVAATTDRGHRQRQQKYFSSPPAMPR